MTWDPNPRFKGMTYCRSTDEQRVKDLNTLTIRTDTSENRLLEDHAASSTDCTTRAIFKNLEQELLSYINDSEVVLGCVAWFTLPSIINALAKKDVSFIVQKEDFLRPDYNLNNFSWAVKLRSLYNQLSGICRMELGDPASGLNYGSSGADNMDPVRCVGNYNEEKNPAFPRMHHKFLLFCRKLPPEENREDPEYSGEFSRIKSYAVWTGSFNITKNATYGFDNAIISTDTQITKAFFNEFCQILALSEPLDWTHKWVAPEFRIGS
jgi:hypothetical protein